MRNILLLLAISMMIVPAVHGIALGVNKAKVNFVDVLRNGYAETSIVASTDTPQNLTLEYRFLGEAGDWMRIVPSNESELVFSRDRPLRIRIIAEPPEDAANGVYTGTLQLLTSGFARSEGQYGSVVRASFGVKLSVDITGDEILSCTSGGYEIVDTETGYPLELHATVQNTGNVRVSPEFEVDIWDQYQTQILQTINVESGNEILPTTQDSLVEQFEVDLPIGQYWARIAEQVCGDERTVTFDVMDLGGISDKGELLRIDNEPWAETNDIIRIAAVFKNLGRRVVNAKFTGTISKDGRTVEIIDTDSLNVRPGATEQFETFFNPTEPGRYEVRGRVNYNGKLTFEKTSTINVQGVSPRVTGNVALRMIRNPYQVAMVFIVIAIGSLMYLIRKEKRR